GVLEAREELALAVGPHRLGAGERTALEEPLLPDPAHHLAVGLVGEAVGELGVVVHHRAVLQVGARRVAQPVAARGELLRRLLAGRLHLRELVAAVEAGEPGEGEDRRGLHRVVLLAREQLAHERQRVGRAEAAERAHQRGARRRLEVAPRRLGDGVARRRVERVVLQVLRPERAARRVGRVHLRDRELLPELAGRDRLGHDEVLDAVVERRARRVQRADVRDRRHRIVHDHVVAEPQHLVGELREEPRRLRLLEQRDLARLRAERRQRAREHLPVLGAAAVAVELRRHFLEVVADRLEDGVGVLQLRRGLGERRGSGGRESERREERETQRARRVRHVSSPPTTPHVTLPGLPCRSLSSKENGTMRTIQGPAIFLAQYMGDAAPFNAIDSITDWVASLGYVGVQIPTWDGRAIDLKKAAASKAYCDEYKMRLAAKGLAITELSTHLQGQLVAVHPAYDELFDGFADPSVRGDPKARTKWAVEQVKLCLKASKNLGLKAMAT